MSDPNSRYNIEQALQKTERANEPSLDWHGPTQQQLEEQSMQEENSPTAPSPFQHQLARQKQKPSGLMLPMPRHPPVKLFEEALRYTATWTLAAMFKKPLEAEKISTTLSEASMLLNMCVQILNRRPQRQQHGLQHPMSSSQQNQ
ncbi:hypothetical protein niasHT_038209 [Heterodera trifolii]|uniref:Uncharacterized protein n=1 Tax=Heterodera trifolii TaxID=157864 RepID=A0ABD2IPQ0_9BILA